MATGITDIRKMVDPSDIILKGAYIYARNSKKIALRHIALRHLPWVVLWPKLVKLQENSETL